MVLAPIRKYKYRKQLKRAGIPESSPSYDIAMDFALRFHRKIEEDLFLLNDLSYQNPDEFKQELNAIWEVYQSRKRPLITTFSTLGLPFMPLKQLIRIYGQGDRAGNILRALLGIRVEQDANAESIYDARSRIAGQTINEFRVPEAALSVSKSPHEFLSNYVFSLLVFSELGFIHPGPCYEHVADLTRRAINADEFRGRLEDVTRRYLKDYAKPWGEDRAVIVSALPCMVGYGFPAVAFLAREGEESTALQYVSKFEANIKQYFGYAILQDVMNPITHYAGNIAEMRECLDSLLETARNLSESGIAPPGFYYVRTFNTFAKSVEDFRQAMTTAQRFFTRLSTCKIKLPQLNYMLDTFANSVLFRDVGEFTETMDEITEDVLQFPYHSQGGYPYPPVDGIGKLCSTPAELIRNNRLYGRLANSLGSAPYLDLVKAVNEQRDSTEDECVDTLSSFYHKVKETPEYNFNGEMTGDSGAFAIWEEFLKRNLLPEILRVKRTGDFDVRVELDTYEGSDYDISYMAEIHYSGINSTKVEVIPK